MSKLVTLRDKDPKEVIRLLSVASGAVLPNPGIEDVIRQSGTDPKIVRSVLSEIRGHLRVLEDDQSIKTYSQIYAFISQEISRATLTSDVVSDVESRLGNRGDLHPSRYEVRFLGNSLEHLEAAGNRKSNIIDVVTHPNEVLHLKAKYISEDMDPRVSVSMKYVASKRSDDRFVVFVVSMREGKVQNVISGYRMYLSDVIVDDLNDPLSVVRSFANNFGAIFVMGGKNYKFMLYETVRLERQIDTSNTVARNVEVLDRVTGHKYGTCIIGGEAMMKGPGGEVIGEVVLGFVVDQTKYLAQLRKHHVNISPDVDEILQRVGVSNYNTVGFRRP
jgi:hypothetical protein